jgi:Mus7/MMS22 family
MAQWKERGFVPDSDDEEDEVVDVLSRDGPSIDKTVSAAQGGEALNAKCQLIPSQSDGLLEKASLTGNDCTVLLAGAQVQSSTPSIHGLGESPRQVQNQQDGGIISPGEGLQKDVLQNSHSEKIVDTQVRDGKDSIAEQLREQLASGLEMIKEVLSGSPASVKGHQLDNRSGTSSPLSSIASFSADEESGTYVQAHASVIRPLDDVSPEHPFSGFAGHWTDHVGISEHAVQVTRRNLRQRNPIQLHPYALEGARYQQELLSRGMRPIYVAGAHRRRHSDVRETQDFEPREDDAGEDSQDITSSQPESIGPLQPIHNEAIKRHSRSRSANDAESDEELPDLDTILRNKYPCLSQPRKRRRGVDGASKSARNHNDEDNQVYDLPSDSDVFTFGGRLSDVVFQVPPSPPHSRSVSSSQSTKRLPRPPVMNSLRDRETPQALPTPNISSATQPSTVPPLQFDADSDSAETGSKKSTDEGDSRTIQLKRKPNGVLPASLFRLRVQQQKSRRKQGKAWGLSDDNVDVRGVAHSFFRPHNSQKSPSRTSSTTIAISDDSSSEEEFMVKESDIPAASSLAQKQHQMMDLGDGDIEEDNRIDMMVPPQSRKRKTANPGHKRQRRIDEFGHATHTQQPYESSRWRTPKRLKRYSRADPAGQTRAGRRSEATALSLGPLDAPGYTDIPRANQPKFLRLAVRRARSSKTSARQSPSRKYIQLATSADNNEANGELRKWRQGLLKQKARGPLNVAVRKVMQQDDQPSENSYEHRLQHVPASRGGQDDPPQARNSHDRSHFEQCPPPIRRTEDVIQGIVQRQIAQPNLSFDHSMTALAQALESGVSTAPHPSAPLHARHRNRSGRGTLLSSAIGSAKPREAQFERTREPKARHRILEAFGGRLHSSQSGKTRDTVAAGTRYPSSPAQVERPASGELVQHVPKQLFSRPVRKRPPKQVNITFPKPIGRPGSSGQVFSADKEDVDANFDADVEALSGVVLAGLGSPESPITRDFGALPFRDGTHLHETGFIGEGHLSQVIISLAYQRRNLIRHAHDLIMVIRPRMSSSPYHWGAWNDEVAHQFSVWFTELNDLLDFRPAQGESVLECSFQNVLAAFKSLISYLNFQASFPDCQTLVAFAEVATTVSQELVHRIQAKFESSLSTISPDVIRVSSLVLVFIFQIACIVTPAAVDNKIQIRLSSTFKTLSLVMLQATFHEDQLVKFRNLVDRRSDILSIGLEHAEIDALVTINHLCKQTVLRMDVWDLVSEALSSAINSKPEKLVTFRDYDGWWKAIFLALPFLEFDASGLLRRRSSPPGWDLVQRLLVRFLQLFIPRHHNTGYSTRQYGRVLLQRCFDLVQVWGWQGGHSAIGTLFDAYSSNHYRELFGETPEHHFRLPLNLTPNPSIRLEKNDSGFHAFLGLLAQTILDCRKPDADSKLAKRVLRSLTARLVPSKGEDLHRNQNHSLNEIIALRNRFDLVSVMYCTMPVEMKPNLRLLQSFVDFRTAHREACRLALECWSHLLQHEVLVDHSRTASEQGASDQHPHTTLLFLREWHDSVVLNLLAEYASQSDTATGLSEHHTICELQNIHKASSVAIAEVLKEALKAYEQGFGFCETTSQATALFSQKMLGELLKLYIAREPATNTIIAVALEIIRAYTSRCVKSKTKAVPMDEDSQEYGSWDHFDVMEIDETSGQNPCQDEYTYLTHEVHPMLRRFVSNVFGSDAVLDHAILKNTADCWYDVADALVSIKARSWDDFVGQHSPDSWESLRQTRYSQQYKIYFLAKVVEHDYGCYDGDRFRILTTWISALCQPRKVLCWEHLLTSIILFHDSDNELLFNPPFAVRSDAGERLEISMTDLCERRTAMIYVVLRNMHRLLATSALPALSLQGSQCYSKSDFCVILRAIESTMKSFYHDLEADQQAQDEYRVFVNFVIQQMQLYVVDFYKIDPFLTDPAITSAEAYAITASLKRYSLTMQTTGVTKAMVLFLYNASERAAINDAQDQFVLQLCNALLDLSQEAIEQTENHESEAVLLTLFLQNIFPAYIGHAFSEPGHILARPLLRALTHVYGNLRCRSDLWSPSHLQGLVGATELILRSTITAFESYGPHIILASSAYLENFDITVKFIHAAMLRMYEAAWAFPDDVDASKLVEILLALKDHIFAVVRPSDADSYLLDLEADQGVIAETFVEHSTIRTYAEKELQTALSRTWRRGTSSGWEIFGKGPVKVVKASKRSSSSAATLSEMEQCKQRMSFVVREFAEAFARLDWWE